jgi:hypothetical protein
MANPDVTGIMNAVIVVVVTKSSAEPTSVEMLEDEVSR